MKLFHLFAATLLGLLVLTACTHHAFPTNYQNRSLKENWMAPINLNPNQWTRGADIWFYTGAPNQTEQFANSAPSDRAMTITAIKVPQFTEVEINGNFQVQIMGEQDHNSVFVLGPNAAAHQVAVSISRNKISINQIQDPSAETHDLSNVIVRIGVQNLRHLNITGQGSVEGRNILSNGLVIDSSTSGTVLMSGRMRLVSLNHSGYGTLSIIGAHTPSLTVNVMGHGNVNISGRVGIQQVTHAGDGIINILGADSDSLTLDTSGCGVTNIVGFVNLKSLTARDSSQIYLYWIKGNSATICAQDQAHLGLAGSVTNLDIDLAGSALLEGEYLHGCNVFAKAKDAAEIDISVDKKIFASASGASRIYFFNSPQLVSQYATDSAMILSVGQPSVPRPTAMMFWRNPAAVKTVSTY